jgi:hypothetical protein
MASQRVVDDGLFLARPRRSLGLTPYPYAMLDGWKPAWL